jgi:hypothetical protein
MITTISIKIRIANWITDANKEILNIPTRISHEDTGVTLRESKRSGSKSERDTRAGIVGS